MTILIGGEVTRTSSFKLPQSLETWYQSSPSARKPVVFRSSKLVAKQPKHKHHCIMWLNESLGQASAALSVLVI